MFIISLADLASCRRHPVNSNVRPHRKPRFDMPPSLQLAASCLALVALTFAVGLRMIFVRTKEMREKRVNPQAASTSLQMAAKLQNVQASDNFKNLFEVPVLFYALVSVALALNQTPSWLVAGAWVFVVLRVVHSFIHCTYNGVMHRFAVFGTSFLLLVVLWFAFIGGLIAKSAA